MDKPVQKDCDRIWACAGCPLKQYVECGEDRRFHHLSLVYRQRIREDNEKWMACAAKAWA